MDASRKFLSLIRWIAPSASIPSTAIFLRARAEIKNLLSEQRAVYRVQLASSEHFLYFPLAAIHMEIRFFKIKQNILKKGFNIERTKFSEASLSDTLSRANQLQSNDVTFPLYFIIHVFLRIRMQRSQEEQPYRTTIDNHI